MRVVTIDFETYFSRDYSLRRMTTEAYIRDPQFQVIGVARKIDDQPAEFSGPRDIQEFLNEVDYSDAAILCHNTAFDGAILGWHYGIKPKLWMDTMSMAAPFHNSVGLGMLAVNYALGTKDAAVLDDTMGKRREEFTLQDWARMINYGTGDAELTYALFKKLRPKVPNMEMLAIDRVLRMFIEPVFELDTTVLRQHHEDILRRSMELTQRLAGKEINIVTSAQKLAKELMRLGVDPPMKYSPRTGRQTYAFAKTDREFTDLLYHPNPEVQDIAAARLGLKSTIEETRTVSFLNIATRGPLPIMLKYNGAHTGRLSGGDKINLQNLPRGGNLRKALAAPEGHTVVTSDLAQIEARLLAYVAGQTDLVKAFAEQRDVYSEFATDVYGRLITKADKTERFVGKTCILGLGYGVGGSKLQRTLKIGQAGISVDVTETEAQRMVSLYRGKNYKIKSLWDTAGYVLRCMANGSTGEINANVRLTYAGNTITLPNGMPLRYPQLTAHMNDFTYLRKGRQLDKLYGAKLVENIIQALAAIIIKEMIVKISTRYHVALQVHDEIVCVVPDEQVGEAVRFITTVMSTPPTWAEGLPIACEVGTGKSYGDAK